MNDLVIDVGDVTIRVMSYGALDAPRRSTNYFLTLDTSCTSNNRTSCVVRRAIGAFLDD